MKTHHRNDDQPRADFHQAVTARIIEMLETARANGAELPWCRPGVSHARPTNATTNQRYRGINVISLWAEAQAKNYRTGLWATFKQWASIGAQVRKGERATPIIVYKPLEIANDKAHTADTGSGPGQAAQATKIIRMVRGYWGFNADQVDNYALPALPTDNLVDPIEHAEEFFSHIGVPITHGGARAFYRPSDDRIQMPDKVLFRGTTTSTATEGYFGVLAHEAGHATGARHRLNRDLSGRFGSKSYAMEEMVAEFISGLICCDLGITAQPREDHAHYIANWLSVLREDKTAVFTAAAAAAKAADFLHALQPRRTADPASSPPALPPDHPYRTTTATTGASL